MSNPGESIAYNKRHEDITKIEGEEDGPEELKKCKNGANKVKSTIGPVAVLRHIEGIELFKCFVLLI